MVVAAVGVLAVLGISALAVQALVAGGGGADSPEAAVDRLADAATAEDPVAVAAALDPAEAESLGELIQDLEQHAQETGFVPEGDTFAGLDITADGLEYEVEDMGDGLARVTVVGGEVGYSFDPDRLAPEAREVVGDEAEPSSEVAHLDEYDGDESLYLVTVRRDGGWYVSIAHTLADYLVEGADLPPGDGDQDLDRSDPAPDPEGAVTGFVQALAQGDVEGMAGHLVGDTGSVLRPYRDAVEEVFGDVTFTVDDVEAEDVEELEDGARRVRILGAEGTFDLDGEEIGWELDGLCVTFDGLDEYFEQQFEQLGEDEWLDEGAFGTDMFFTGFAEELCRMIQESAIGRALGTDGLSVVVVPERGGWAVSPVDTALLAVRDILPTLDRDALVALLGRPDLVTPDGEAPFGELFTADLADDGVATYTFTPPEDLELVMSVDGEDGYADLVGPDGDHPEYTDHGFQVEGGTEYRVIVQGFGLGATSVDLALGRVAQDDLGEVSLAGTISGALTPAEPVRRTSFTLDREVRAEVHSDSDVYLEIYEDGEYACSEGERCSFAPGHDYEAVVSLEYGTALDDDADYEVGFDIQAPPAPGTATDATIDGETSVTGELLYPDESAYHDVVVPDGVTVVVTVTADDPDADIDAYIADEYYEDGGDEEFELVGPIDEELEIILYTEDPTGYEVTLTPA